MIKLNEILLNSPLKCESDVKGHVSITTQFGESYSVSNKNCTPLTDEDYSLLKNLTLQEAERKFLVTPRFNENL